jgi:hypothetical protein
MILINHKSNWYILLIDLGKISWVLWLLTAFFCPFLENDGSCISPWKISQDAFSGSCQNERLAWSCKHLHLVMDLKDDQQQALDFWVIRQRVNLINRKRKLQRPFLKTMPKSLVTVTVTGQKWKIHFIFALFHCILSLCRCEYFHSSRRKIF